MAADQVASRRLAQWAAALLVAGLLAVLPVEAAEAGNKDPEADFTRLPHQCLTSGEKRPRGPIVCNLNKFVPNRPTVVLWGDSHMWMMIPAIKQASRRKPVNLVTFIQGACPPGNPVLTARTRRSANSCEETNDRAMRFVRKLQKRNRPVSVILGSFWGLYLQALKQMRAGERPASINESSAKFFRRSTPALFKWLGKHRVDVDVDAQGASVPADEPTCARDTYPWSCAVPRSRAMFAERDTYRFLRNNIPKLSGRPRYIDVNRSFCNASVCRARTSGGIYTWWDRLHLSATKSATLGKFFAPTINEAARRHRPGIRNKRSRGSCRIPIVALPCIPRR